MRQQLYYEDIEAGTEIAPMIKQPDTRQLVMWAGASGDYNPIHYDKDFAQSRGLPGVIVHGQLVCSFLGQLITDWIGEQGSLKKLNCNYRGMNIPGQPITLKGKVTKKYLEGEDPRVECKVWAENPKGEKTVTGTATVAIPSKG